jgi:hypothetical protein
MAKLTDTDTVSLDVGTGVGRLVGPTVGAGVGG